MAAVQYKKRIVILQELNPTKGGVPLATHIDEAMKHVAAHPEMAGVVEVLRTHSEHGWIIPWHRIRVFQDVTLRLALAPIVCTDDDKVDAAATRQGKDVYISTELTRAPLKPLGPGCHLYVSRNNPGAAEFAQQLADDMAHAAGRNMRRQRLEWTDDANMEAQRFLLLLNRATWDPTANSRFDELHR